MTATEHAAQTRSDRSERWVRSYRSVRKDPARSDAATNRTRLRRLGAPALATDAPWVDVGAGDGNLVDALATIGVASVVAVEPQAVLLTQHRRRQGRVQGSATALPLRSGTAAVVVAMDVLHHLTAAELPTALAEARRVLRPGGHLLVCEPTQTRVRSLLDRLLRSPLGSTTQFTRHKRAIVEEEAATLYPWLARERDFVATAEASGFVVEAADRGPLHACTRLRRR